MALQMALDAPDLVSLSACHTADVSPGGDEWVSLVQAFLTAGSRTVVAAQGRISDLSAALMMKRFYRDLGGASRAAALQKAALWTRRYYAHPAHWATFALYGDFR